MRTDYKQHLYFGMAGLIGALGLIWVYHRFGLPWVWPYTTTMLGLANEVRQVVLKNGDPDPWDAFYTALPGWAALAVHLALGPLVPVQLIAR